MAKEIHIRKPLAVGNDSIAKGFLSFNPEAIALLRACLDLGIAHPSRIEQVIRYLEGNIDSIAVEGPSLGTMESENQHLYGARMDCWPCACSSPKAPAWKTPPRSRAWSRRRFPR